MGRKYKTKFPMARIKKIMQLDNEIGKVALATPILISKALEVFMQNLVDEACLGAQNHNSTKLEPIYLKRCINEVEEFDFLKDIVANVEEPTLMPSIDEASKEPVQEEVTEKHESSSESTLDLESRDDEEPQTLAACSASEGKTKGISISSVLNDEPALPTAEES